MLPILEPVTPGALRRSIDCRIPSRSATQEDMIKVPVQARAYFSLFQTRRTGDVLQVAISVYLACTNASSRSMKRGVADQEDGIVDGVVVKIQGGDRKVKLEGK